MIQQPAILAFGDELQKIAAPSAASILGAVKRQLPTVGGAAGIGGLVGGIGGAGLGAYRSYTNARDQGATRGEAAKGALFGGLQGGISGGAKGLVAGGAVGALGGDRVRNLVHDITAQPGVVGGASRFGQRQVHGLTGVLPEAATRHEALRSIGASPRAAAEARMQASISKLQKAPTEANVRASAAASKGLQAASELERRELTSIPGYVKGLVKDPIGTVGTVASSAWNGSDTLGKAMMVGLPAYQAYGLMKSGPDNRGERLGGLLGSTAMSFAAPQVGIIGDSLLNMAGSGAGKAIGKRLDSRKNMVGLPHPTSVGHYAPTDGSSPAERIYSDRASGRAAEGIVG